MTALRDVEQAVPSGHEILKNLAPVLILVVTLIALTLVSTAGWEELSDRLAGLTAIACFELVSLLFMGWLLGVVVYVYGSDGCECVGAV